MAGGEPEHHATSTSTAINWTDEVDDLIDRGDIEAAVSLLESVVSHLEPAGAGRGDARLATALDDLANLHSSRGCSLKADELRARSLLIRSQASGHLDQRSSPPPPEAHRASEIEKEKAPQKGENGIASSRDASDDEDDWEAVAERALPEVQISKSMIEEPLQSRMPVEVAKPQRRGRGSFMYRKNGLFSDEVDNSKDVHCSVSDADSERQCHLHDDTGSQIRTFGIGHVLVMYDFSPSTRTTDLEKLFEKYGDAAVAIRWVNDTCALAVFRTPTTAHDAKVSIQFPFKVRDIDDGDSILTQLSSKDLEPPCPRPKTSARTAQRLIAQVMGFKPSSGFDSTELRKQEQARKNRIHARHSLRDDAWGSDDP